MMYQYLTYHTEALELTQQAICGKVNQNCMLLDLLSLCMYIRMYTCMLASLYVCTCVLLYVRLCYCMYVCATVCMFVCMYVIRILTMLPSK